MNASTWIFGVRPFVDPSDDEPLYLVALLVGEEDASSALLDHPPSDEEIAGLYESAVTGDDAHPPRTPPKIVLVEDGPMAKRVRSLFRRGARVEIDRTARDALDAFAQEVVDEAMDAEVFESLPDEWKETLVGLGARLEDAAPWEHVPPGALLRVSLPSLGVEDGRVSVMGHRTRGFILFASADDYAQFHASSRALAETRALAPFPRIVGVEVVDVARDGERVVVANVDARTSEGSEDATPEEVRRCVVVGELLLACLEAGPLSTTPSEREVSVRGETVRGSLALLGA